MYTRRNSIESSGQHWLVLLAALLTTWMAWGPMGVEVQSLGAASAVGLLLLNAVAVTLLATRAVRKGQSLNDTMGWESVTTYASLLLVALLIAIDRGPGGANPLRRVPVGAVPGDVGRARVHRPRPCSARR